MALTTAGLNTAADAVAGQSSHLALFDGDPSGAGSELSGGSPAYARQSITWGAATGGVATASNTPISFDVPSGATVDYFALYDALTVGERQGDAALSASEGPYGAQGTYDVTALTITIT